MPKKVFSGKAVIKILCRYFGFKFVSQKGSHVKLGKIIGGKEIVTVVPLHKSWQSELSGAHWSWRRLI
jgi:predicted RNA binding protein YcfA (HicA-like mRNA interferase family)